MRIRLIAPGYRLAGDCQAALQEIKEFLAQEWGCEVVFSPHIISEEPDTVIPQRANTPQKTAEDLIDAFQSDAPVIWCVRGGSLGEIAAREANLTLRDSPARTPKLLIGFSDNTSLLNIASGGWGPITPIHGPVAIQVAKGLVAPEDVAVLKQIVMGELSSLTLAGDLKPLNACAKEDRTLSGTTICGGNLTSIARLIGTSLAVNTGGRIFLVEDTGEPPRRLMGKLQQLLTIWIENPAQRPSAVLIGLVDNSDPAEQEADQKVMGDFVEQLQKMDIPAIGCENIGHGKSNHPLLLYTLATLCFGENPILKVTVPQLQQKEKISFATASCSHFAPAHPTVVRESVTDPMVSAPSSSPAMLKGQTG